MAGSTRRSRLHPGSYASRSTPQSIPSVGVATAASLTRGRVLEEGQVGEAAAAVREALATGPTVDRRIEGNRRALMPYVALLAILPLGFVLYRRNL